MGTNLATIDIDVPVEVAYDQWTNLHMFPAFMGDVDRVTKIESGRHQWVTKINGVERQFDSRIVEHVPEERIAWTSVDGVEQDGEVTFERMDDERTRISICVDLEPRTMVEQVADQLGVVRRHLQSGLEEFKVNVEARPIGVDLNASYDPTE